MDSSFCQRNLVSGIADPLVLFRIPKSRIFVSTKQCFPDSESGNTYMERNTIIRKLHSRELEGWWGGGGKGGLSKL